MRVFAIADPHLSSAEPKPMTIFGPGWQGHPERFFEGWRETVGEQDLVLVPGDVSWAMTLGAALLDLQDIAALPGRKVLLRGNHDYWWSSIGKLRAALPQDMYALQNDALRLGNLVVAGTRGWVCPGSSEFSAEDARIYTREVGRLELSLASARKLRQPGDALAVMLHYPPTNARLESSGFTEVLAGVGADVIVYGHLHGERRAPFTLGETPCYLVAADALGFCPKELLELT